MENSDSYTQKTERLNSVSNSLLLTGTGVTVTGLGIFFAGLYWANNSSGGPAGFVMLGGFGISISGAPIFTTGLVIKTVVLSRKKTAYLYLQGNGLTFKLEF